MRQGLQEDDVEHSPAPRARTAPTAPARNGTNGTNGTNGINGGSLKVHDSAGNLIGAFAGLGKPFPAFFTTYTVLGADGGLYSYLPSGQLMPMLAFGFPIFRGFGLQRPRIHLHRRLASRA